MLAGFMLFACGGETQRLKSDGTPMNEREKLIDDQFSQWDGSHDGLTDLIKKGMNDPSSYEHVETRYKDNGDHIGVIAKFRGNNAFGGKVLNTVLAKVDFEGNVVSIDAQY